MCLLDKAFNVANNPKLDSLQIFCGRKSKRSVIKNDVKSNPKPTDELNENHVHLLKITFGLLILLVCN